MKKAIHTPEGFEILDLTAEEVSKFEEEKTASQNAEAQAQADKEEKENLKASAKTKLIAGEKLTEEEANILVGV